MRQYKGKRSKTKPSKALAKKQAAKAEETFKKAPHSIVFSRGKVGRYIRQLSKDMRLVMEPYTASKLQMMKKNVLKDFLSVSSMLNISHFLSFTKSDISVNLHIGKVPRGPTLTFRVTDYCLMQDVLSYLKKPTLHQASYTTHPLLVMNNFNSPELHMKLMTSMFQNMFPSISVDAVKLTNIRRCVLLSYNTDTDTIDFRHYMIRVVPSGMSRAVRKLIKPKIPDLGRFNDIADYIDQGGNLSESEAENDGDHNQIVLPQNMPTRGNLRGSRSAIRLVEVGPRLTLKLHKIEEGFWAGNVLYNAVVTKTSNDVRTTERHRAKKVSERSERTRVQTENVKRKEDEKKAHKDKSLAGMRRKWGVSENKEKADEVVREREVVDDDAKYYLEEVGLPPADDLLLPGTKRKASDESEGTDDAKRQKASGSADSPRLSKLARQRNKAVGDERRPTYIHRQKGTGMGKGSRHPANTSRKMNEHTSKSMNKGDRRSSKGDREGSKGDRRSSKGDREGSKGDRQSSKGDREGGKGDRPRRSKGEKRGTYVIKGKRSKTRK